MAELGTPNSLVWFPHFETHPTPALFIRNGTDEIKAVPFRKLNSTLAPFYVLFLEATAQVQIKWLKLSYLSLLNAL